DVVFKDALRYWDHACKIRGARARVRFYVSKMRRSAGLWTMAQKEDVDPARTLKVLNVSCQLSLEIDRISSHRGKTFDLGEELISEQSLKVADETEGIVHPHWCERVLREHLQTRKHAIFSAFGGKLAKLPVK